MRITALSVACVLVAGARAVHADPLPPPDGSQAPGMALSTSSMVLRMSRALTGNNLRIGLQCADYFATPDQGLRVTLDGTEPPMVTVNGVDGVAYTRHGNPIETWSPTDVGFDAAPGHHRLAIDAPGCISETHDVDIAMAGPTFVTGRLALADSSLMGPVGAPDGLGFTIGGYVASRPAVTNATNNGTFGNSIYSMNSSSWNGVSVSTTMEHRHVAFALDMNFAWDSLTGSGVQTAGDGGNNGAMIPFAQNAIQFGGRLRIGARLPLRNVALAAGFGFGGDIDLVTSSTNTATGASTAFNGLPDGGSGDWYIPLWASVTVKPTCSLGLQLLASYDERPTDSANSSLSIGAGLVFQPSASCSDPVGVTVR